MEISPSNVGDFGSLGKVINVGIGEMINYLINHLNSNLNSGFDVQHITTMDNYTDYAKNVHYNLTIKPLTTVGENPLITRRPLVTHHI